jgi:hypothetical protein
MINIDERKVGGAKITNLYINARGARANAFSRRRLILFIIFSKGHNSVHENGAPPVR